MFAITLQLCEGMDKDATVSLEFSTTGGTCTTEDLRHEGSTETWFRYGPKYLGNCQRFKPTKDMHAKFLLRDRWSQEPDAPEIYIEKNTPADHMKICKLTVFFGDYFKDRIFWKEGSEEWEWSGETTVSRNHGNWLKLVRVLGTPPPF